MIKIIAKLTVFDACLSREAFFLFGVVFSLYTNANALYMKCVHTCTTHATAAQWLGLKPVSSVK
jgi:hypothetical protein